MAALSNETVFREVKSGEVIFPMDPKQRALLSLVFAVVVTPVIFYFFRDATDVTFRSRGGSFETDAKVHLFLRPAGSPNQYVTPSAGLMRSLEEHLELGAPEWVELQSQKLSFEDAKISWTQEVRREDNTITVRGYTCRIRVKGKAKEIRPHTRIWLRPKKGSEKVFTKSDLHAVHAGGSSDKHKPFKMQDGRLNVLTLTHRSYGYTAVCHLALAGLLFVLAMFIRFEK